MKIKKKVITLLSGSLLLVSLNCFANTANTDAKPSSILVFFANAGVPSAEFELGRFYYDQHNYLTATKWWLQENQTQYTDGVVSFGLGLAYEHLQQTDKAIKYYKQSAIQYHKASAAFNLAVIYHRQAQEELTLKYLKMAAKDGSSKAQEILKKLGAN